MRKRKAKSAKPSYEVVDDTEIRRVVDLLVDFSEKQKLPAKTVMLAMDFIVGKIKSHLGVETISIQEISSELH